MRTFVLAAMVAILFGAPSARAGEPQILGLVATSEPIPLSCADGICTAELSAFCLQRRSAVPFAGTAYEIVADRTDAVRVVGRDDNGRRIRHSLLSQSGPSGANLVSIRGNRAVQITVSADLPVTIGLRQAAIEIGAGVSAIPASLHRRRYAPEVNAEISLVTGSMRTAAVGIVDDGGALADGARWLNLLVNAIPNGNGGDVEDREAVWQETFGHSASAGGERPNGISLARRGFDRCADLPGGGFVSFRQCLAAQHDMLIDPLNAGYWEAIDTGS